VLLLLSFAMAGVSEDLAVAADVDQPLALRQAAFGRMADPASTDRVLALVEDTETSNDQKWVLIRSLGTNPTPEAREALLRFLGDKNALTRMAALEGLGDRADRTLSGRVAARLTDPAILVRYAAIDALARMKDPSTLGDLARVLEDPTNRYRGASLWVRRRATEALASIGTDAAVPHLARALDDDDPDVVNAAVRGLETVAGFSYKEGRNASEEITAWKRWAGSR
jgi:HEAT repeat protein